ncbi:PEP-CTERM sorting domain-containing protein [Oceanibacterium hippocampi]|uniref:Ice-binding protein C-terminal domain-containing protein n=1 Tax=Oceanibacterium hippocampi TaxID=745714 RepID=A0A1Y5S6G8_9PROT|nr:PEP-CTERM sorting domain-containing protein [Oceanibacterium hippocampi]SLN32716.1 hypothetical protein OCH7691_01228 [Oceanibacterium hippocampi]
MNSKHLPYSKRRKARARTATGIVSATLAAGVSLLAINAHATVVTDGLVFPNLEVTPTGTSQINVGFANNPGELEVNASTAGNGFTEVTGSALLVGNGSSGPGATGEVRIIGDGTSGSAKISISSGVGARIGFGEAGTLAISQGGVLEGVGSVHLGENGLSGTNGSSMTTVDGAGSILRVTNEINSGARLYVPFESVDSELNVTNGGRVEAVGGDIDNFEQGAVFVGNFDDRSANVEVNVTGQGSVMEATHGIFVQQGYGSATVNITDGGAVSQLQEGFFFNGMVQPGIAIDSFEANGAQVNVSGVSGGGTASSLNAVTDIQLGADRAVYGFTASGEPRILYDDNTIQEGQQVRDVNGELLFNQNGDPVLAVNTELFPGFFLLLPDTFGSDFRVRTTGHLLAENGGEINTLGDINVSTDSDAMSVSGQPSTLTVRDGGVVNAQNINVNKDGLLNGGNGIINANVNVNGGTVAPGNSPGTMFINGDVNLNDGFLDLEIEAGLQDLIDIAGDLFIGEDFVINLIFGFDPVDEVFNLADFFSADNIFSDFSLNNLTVAGLGNAAKLTIIGFAGGQVSIDNTAQVPEPAALLIFGAGLAGLMVVRRRRKTA